MSELTDLQDRLTKIRDALDHARRAVNINVGGQSMQRNYDRLLDEERMVMRRIARLEGKSPMISNANMS